MNGQIFGYDPGGKKAHGVARAVVENGRITSLQTATKTNVEEVIEWFGTGVRPVGIGIDTLTVWSTGDSGWRPADRWLRKQYPPVQLSVASPNSLFGSMGLNGMMVMHLLQEKWEDLIVAVTRPLNKTCVGDSLLVSGQSLRSCNMPIDP